MAALLQWGMLLRLALAASTAVPPPHPIDLRVEHMPSPVLGLDPARPPRLTFRLPADSPAGSRCAAARFELSSKASVVWDSGKVASGETAAVVPAHIALSPDSTYTWRCQYWLAAGGGAPSAWSEPQPFHTAPTARTWSGAAWLNGSAGMLRHQFSAPAEIEEAFVFASTIGFHELRLNAVVLGDGTDKLLEPGVGVYPLRALFTTHNVTSLLRPGAPNTLGALLGHGPSCVCSHSGPSPCSDQSNTLPLTQPQCADITAGGSAAGAGGCKAGSSNGNAFRAVLSLRRRDGSVEHIVSRPVGWETRPPTWASPMVYNDMYAGERWDARAAEATASFWEPGVGVVPAVAASAIAPAGAGASFVEGGGVNASAVMASSVAPPMRVTKVYPALTVQQAEASSELWTFDFGTTLEGVAELAVHGPRGALVKADYAVMLLNGSAATQFAPQTSVEYILSGNGSATSPEVYRPKFCYFNFRYVTLNVSGLGPGFVPHLGTVTALRIGSDTTGNAWQRAQRGLGRAERDTAWSAWESDNALLTRYSDLSVRTQLMNMMSIPMDTPDRERHGWTGDSQLQLEIGLLNLDAANFASNWLQILRDQMSYSGFITDIAPNPSGGPYGTGAGPPDPAWTSTLPNVARWLYETTGDARVAEDNYGAVVRWLTFYSDEAHASSTPGLIDISKWCDYLCMNILYGAKTKGQQPSLDFGLSDNKFFLDGLRTAASFAEVLGKSDDAARWRAQIANTSAAYTQEFFHSGGSPAAAAQGLYLRQTSYMGYATPCSDNICAYDSTFKLVAGISGAGGGDSVSFMSIPESGLAPCKTDSNVSCPWYLIVDGGRVNAALDNGTGAFKQVASWKRVPGLSDTSAMSFRSQHDQSLYLAVSPGDAPVAGDVPLGSRYLVAAPAASLKSGARATWSAEPPNAPAAVPLPTSPPGSWHSFRSHANDTSVTPFSADFTRKNGNLSILANVNNTQTLTGLALTSGALPPEDARGAASVLLNDLLSGATFDGAITFAKRGHLTGGMVGIKATLDALALLDRGTELLEVLTLTDFPSLGNMVESGATALWSDWGDQMTADGLYFSGGAPCANGCAESFAAAWLSLAVKYYFVVFAGLTQAEGTAGYKQLVLRPNIPRPVRDPSRALNMVRSSMQTPHGAVESCWERGRDGGSGVEFEFRIPPNADATLVLPVVGLSNVSVALASEGAAAETLVYDHVVGFVAPAASGLTAASPANAVVGSFAAIQLHAAPGRYKLALRGTPGTAVCTGDDHKLECPSGMRIVAIEQAAFGTVTPPSRCGEPATVSCAAGSSRHHVERLCLGKTECQLSASSEVYDPAGQLPEHCRGDEEGGETGAAADSAPRAQAVALYVQAVCGSV